jgi:phosphatidylglycerophosphate synthase
MDPTIVASQKKHDMLSAFWPRKLSPYITSVMVRTPITPNQTTALWGVISVLNSGLVYLAMLGHYWLIPIIPLVYIFAFVLDCVDGEIARYKNIANPVGGKLLDGISHRVTEYSLLVAFTLGAFALTNSWWAVLVGGLLFAGDAMYSYVYERRLSTLRVHAGFTGRIKHAETGVYERGTPFRALTRGQQIRTITGQLKQYKSIYPVIAASYVSPLVLLSGLAALALFKHWRWIRLVAKTLREVKPAEGQMPSTVKEPETPVAVAGSAH